MSIAIPDASDRLDHADRANQHRQSGLLRIHLKKIGFWPGNRSGMGILPVHVHEVVHDIVHGGTILERYDAVKVVKIPPGMLDTINKKRQSIWRERPAEART